MHRLSICSLVSAAALVSAPSPATAQQPKVNFVTSTSAESPKQVVAQGENLESVVAVSIDGVLLSSGIVSTPTTVRFTPPPNVPGLRVEL